MFGLMPQQATFRSLPIILRIGDNGGKTLKKSTWFNSWVKTMFLSIPFYSQVRRLLLIKTGLFWAKSVPLTISTTKTPNSVKEMELESLGQMSRSVQSYQFLLGDITCYQSDLKVRTLSSNGLISRPRSIMSQLITLVTFTIEF